MANRAERRRQEREAKKTNTAKAKSIQERMTKMTPEQFEATVNQVVYGTQAEVMRVVKDVLYEEFGFGDRRFNRIQEKVYSKLEKIEQGKVVG